MSKEVATLVSRGNARTSPIVLIWRLAEAYNVPIDDAFDLWIEADGDLSEYEKRLEKWWKT